MVASEPISRRGFLLSAIACGFPAGAIAGPLARPRRIVEWDSGSEVLAPLTLHQGNVLFAGDRTIGRIDLKTSKVAWKHAHGLSDEAVYRPRAVGKQMLVGSLHELGAWDLARGRRTWLRRAAIQMGVPFVSQKVSYVGDGHELLAVDNSNGEVRWKFAGVLDTLSSYAPVQWGDTVYWGPGDGILYAIHATSGHLKWRLDRSAEWQYLRQIYVGNGVLVAGTYKELLLGISLEDGKVLWAFNAGNFINSHHVAGTTAYLWSPTGWVYAIDILSGEVLWRHQTTNYGQSSGNWGAMMAEIVVHGGLLYALDMNNVLHLLDVEDGREIRRIAFQQELRPVVLPGNGSWAVVATDSGRIQQAFWPR